MSPADQNRLLASDDSLNAVARDPVGESILEQRQTAIPSDIEDIFDRLGQRVERRHVFAPFGDDRPETLPVEEIEIVPVRWETY
jgi:hypothetical protein